MKNLSKVAPGDLLCFRSGNEGGSLWIDDGTLRTRIIEFRAGDVALVVGHSSSKGMMVLSRGCYGMIPFLTKWDKVA